MKFQNTRNKNRSKERGTEPVPHKGAGIGSTQDWKLEKLAMPKNAEEK